MIDMHLYRELSINVVGVGCRGIHVIDSMIEAGTTTSVKYIAVDTETISLEATKADKAIRIGSGLRPKKPSVSNPKWGAKAAREAQNELEADFKDAHIVFVISEFDDLTTAGAALVVAGIAKQLGILTVCLVITPFALESKRFQKKRAERAIKELYSQADMVMAVSEKNILDLYDAEREVPETYREANGFIRHVIQDMIQSFTIAGIINLDYSDFSTFAKNAGRAYVGIGIGTGDAMAEKAMHMAMQGSLSTGGIRKAARILLAVTCSDDTLYEEVNSVLKTITNAANPDAEIICGVALDQSMNRSMRVFLIAAEFAPDNVLRYMYFI